MGGKRSSGLEVVRRITNASIVSVQFPRGSKCSHDMCRNVLSGECRFLIQALQCLALSIAFGSEMGRCGDVAPQACISRAHHDLPAIRKQ